MTVRPLQQISATSWDVFLAAVPVLLTYVWPDIFSQWLAASGLPLLACRYALARLER